MANRVPQTFIDDLLARVDIVQIIDRHVPLKKAGNNYKALCPFHHEKTPSFSVSSTKQFYYCFGCGASGTAISFIMNFMHLGFVEAIEHLAHEVGMTLPDAVHDTQQQSNAPLYHIMEKVMLFYQQQLEKNDTAKNYLKTQRQLSPAIIKHFNIGYAASGQAQLSKRFPPQTHAELKASGMLIEKDQQESYDRFRQRVMFPIRDRRGRVVGFGGRIIGDGIPKYLNSPETAIFHKSQELYGLYEALQQRHKLTRLLVVEGYMDVLALVQHGFYYTVATLGTAVGNRHIQRLFQVCNDVIFCFDGDNAGRQAAWRTVEVILPLLQDKWQPRFMFLPEGEDPDSLARREGKARLEQRLARAHSLSDFFIHYMTRQADMNKLDGRARFARLAMEQARKISSPIMQTMMMTAIANTAGLDVSALDDAATALDNKTVARQKPENKQQNHHNKPISPLRKAILLLLQHPQLAKHCQTVTMIDQPGWDLLHQLIDLLQRQPQLSTAALLEHWRDKPEYNYLIKLVKIEHIIPEHGLESEFTDIMSYLQQQAMEITIKKLVEKNRQQTISEQEKTLLQQLIKQRQLS